MLSYYLLASKTSSAEGRVRALCRNIVLHSDADHGSKGVSTDTFKNKTGGRSRGDLNI